MSEAHDPKLERLPRTIEEWHAGPCPHPTVDVTTERTGALITAYVDECRHCRQELRRREWSASKQDFVDVERRVKTVQMTPAELVLADRVAKLSASVRAWEQVAKASKNHDAIGVIFAKNALREAYGAMGQEAPL